MNARDDIAVTSYLITAGNSNYAFAINTNGQIKNIMKLDYDTTPIYNLFIQVSDAAGNTSNAAITVNVIDVDAAPTVTTLNASGIQNNSVILNGNLIDLGTNSDSSRQVNEYGFIYSTNAPNSNDLQLGHSGVDKIAGDIRSSTGQYNFVLSELLQGTPHYYRAFAVNDGGTNYGAASNFSTTAHQAFILNGSTDGEQSNSIYPHSTHSYNVSLSHELVYSLTANGSNDILDSITIYEGANTNSLYIKAGPFSLTPENDGVYTNINGNVTNVSTNETVTFSGVNSGRRYMVLPLASNFHQIVISNGSGQSRGYTLNLEEYQGSNPSTRRLPMEPQKVGFYDSSGAPRHFWVHLPANKELHVELDSIRNTNNPGVSVLAVRDIGNIPEFDTIFTTALTPDGPISDSSIRSRYFIFALRSSLSLQGPHELNTNFRFVFRFVDAN